MIRPINEYIVLKQVDNKGKYGKLIVIDENEKKKTNIGIVCALSSFKDETIKIKIGDKIIYRDYAVNEYIKDNEKFLLVQVEDVLAIIDEGE